MHARAYRGIYGESSIRCHANPEQQVLERAVASRNPAQKLKWMWLPHAALTEIYRIIAHKRREYFLCSAARYGETSMSARITCGQCFAEKLRLWLIWPESKIWSQQRFLVKLQRYQASISASSLNLLKYHMLKKNSVLLDTMNKRTKAQRQLMTMRMK